MSSLVGKAEGNVELNAPADKFYGMLCSSLSHVPDTSPDKVQACTLLEGNWGNIGCIIYWNYVQDGEPKVVKEVIEGIDAKNYSISARVIEGDLLKEYKSFVMKVQVVPKSQDDGCIARWTLEYEKLHQGIADPNTFLELIKQLSKDMASHLMQAN